MRPIDADKVIEKFDRISKNFSERMGKNYINREGISFFMNNLKNYINNQPTIDINDLKNGDTK